MSTPLPILRKRADEALVAFAASSGCDPEEVWEGLISSQEIPEILAHTETGDTLWERFQTLRREEITILKNLRQG